MPDRPTIAAFIGFVLIGGVNFVAVRFSNRELPPMFGAGIRFSIAAALAAGRFDPRVTGTRNKSLLGAVAHGLLAFTVAYACGNVARSVKTNVLARQNRVMAPSRRAKTSQRATTGRG